MKMIYANWAVLTKIPGDVKDYRILSNSRGDLSPQAYYTVIRRWLSGEMPKEASQYNPADPWFQFGIETVPVLRQVVLRQEWTGYGDASSRPVQKTICLLLPFNDLASAGCGFSNMAGLFEQAQVKDFLAERADEIARGEINRECDPIEIAISDDPESSNEFAQAVREVGLDFCLQATNALLTGIPVALIQPSGEIRSWQERLKWLDAALSLLPYGVRAECPVSAWAAAGVEHAMHLYWSRSALPSHARLVAPLQGQVTSSVENKHWFVEDFQNLYERQWINLESVILSMTRLSSPASFTSLSLREILYKLGGMHAILARVDREAKVASLSSETAGEALQIIQNGLLDEMPAQERTDFIKCVLPHLRQEHVPFILRHWNDVLAERTIQQVIQAFNDSDIERQGERFFVRIFLLARTGATKDLFQQLWKSRELFQLPEQSSRFCRAFLILLHQALQDEAYSDSAGWGTGHPVETWTVEADLPQDYLYAWAELILQDSRVRKIEPLTHVLRRLPSKDDVLTSGLRAAWGMPEPLRYSFRNIPQEQVKYLPRLIQISVGRQTLGKIFELAATELLRRVVYDQTNVTDELRVIIETIRPQPQSLSSKECALLDEIRLCLNINNLSLPEALNRFPNDFKRYTESMADFIRYWPAGRRIWLFDRFSHQLNELLLSGLSGDAPTNLKNFCKEMQATTEDHRWGNVRTAQNEDPIVRALKARAPLQDVVEACRPFISSVKGVDELERIIDRLCQLLKQHRYPNSGRDLFVLVDLLCGIAVALEFSRAWAESQFHFRVLNGKVSDEQAIVYDYAAYLARYYQYHIDGMIQNTAELRKYPRARNYCDQIRDDKLPTLKRKLDGR